MRGRLHKTTLCAGFALGAGLALSAFAPVVARAEPVRVGAGEHRDYSRVVLNLTPPAGWRSENGAEGVVIRLPGAQGPFLDEAVTTRRRAHRVSSFETAREDGETVLRLGFNCVCEATVYELEGRALVIDIRDDAPVIETADAETDAPDAEPEAAANAETTEAPSPDVVDVAAPADPRDVDIEFAQAQLIESLQRAEEQGFVAFRPDSPLAQRDAPEPDAGATEDEPTGETAEAEDAPRDDDDSAAVDEMVDSPPTPTDEAAASRAAAPEDDEDASSLREDAAISDESAASDGLEALGDVQDDAQDDAEEERGIDESGDDVAAAPPPCLPDDAFDIAAWRSDAPFYEELASRRSAVLDTFNRASEEAVADLARHYLVAGLGFEAAAAPESFGVDTPETRLVAAMGRVVEGRRPAPGDPFDRAEPCPGRHGLWQAAALAPHEPIASAAAYDASGRALAQTPEPLRRLIGARIGRALAAAGEYDKAAELLQLLNRSVEPPSDEMLLLEAELLLDEGRTAAAAALLRRVIDGGRPLSVVAMVRLSEILSPRARAQAAALALRLNDATTEWRGETYVESIVAAEAKLRARFGDLVGAVAAIDHLQSRLDAPSARLRALRGALIETEIVEIARFGEAERIAAAIEVVSAEGSDEGGVRLRLLLAEALIDSSTAHLAPLVLPTELQLADPRAAEIALRAEAAANLAGAPVRYPNAPPPGAPGAPIETADAEPAAVFDFAALRRRAFAAYLGGPEPRAAIVADLERSGHPEAPALLSLLQNATEDPSAAFGPVVETPAAVSDGRALLQDLDAELELMREIARDG